MISSERLEIRKFCYIGNTYRKLRKAVVEEMASLVYKKFHCRVYFTAGFYAGLNIYPETHRGLARVVVKTEEKVKEKRKSQNLLILARIISEMKEGVEEIMPCKKGIIEVKFRNKEEANFFAHNVRHTRTLSNH